jgi:cell wall-associated NlpC family hydrolase
MPKRLVPLAIALLALAAPASASAESNGGLAAPSGPVAAGGTAYGGVPAPTSQPQTQQPAAPPPAPVTRGAAAVLNSAGLARAPRSAPRAVKLAVAAANQLQRLPYRWGGGHAAFKDTAYDCSGTVSYMLHGAGLLASPLDSTGLVTWGLPGPGRWITIYANAAHTYAVVAGLRLDTAGGPGPRWHVPPRSSAGFVVRHPPGF